MLKEAFLSDIGIENSPIRADDDSWVFFEVTDITPARDRTLDEVRDKVVADWTQAETEKRIADKAEALFKRLQDGENACRDRRGDRQDRADHGRREARRYAAGGAHRQRRQPSVCRPRRARGGRRRRGRQPHPPQGRSRRGSGLLCGNHGRQTDHGAALQRRCRTTSSRSSTSSVGNSHAVTINNAVFQQVVVATGRPDPAAMKVEPDFEALRADLPARRAAARLDAAGLRPGDAGLRLPEDRRQPPKRLPAGIGGRRRGARALFHARLRPRPHLPRRGRQQRRSRARRT